MSKDTDRKKLVVGNWKMYLNTHQASLYLHKLADAIPVRRGVEVVLTPSLLVLQSLSLQVNRRQFKLSAQNGYWRDEGAYTGEVSMTMLRGSVEYVLVGHSERRHIFHEHERDIRHKVQAALRNNIRPILCIGETTRERAEGETTHVLHDQLISGLMNVTSEEIADVVVAYEPVWAIGTGVAAKPQDIEVTAQVIRKQIAALYGKKAAAEVQLLYGGSVTSDNCQDFLSIEGIDGLLVGGASLKADQFASIVEKAHNSRKQKG